MSNPVFSSVSLPPVPQREARRWIGRRIPALSVPVLSVPVLAALGLGVGACGGATATPESAVSTSDGPAVAPTAAPTFPAPGTPVTQYPGKMLVAAGQGPALFLSESPDAPAVGFISSGVTVNLAGDPVQGRVPVVIDGPLKAQGWVPTERLSLRVRQRGKVRGTPVYVGPGDAVGVRSRSSEQGLLNLSVAADLGRDGAAPVGPFQGEYPENRLSADNLDFASLEGPTSGPAFSLPAGQQVPVYDSPNGSVVATLPALQPPLVVTVLRDRNPWKGIRAGVGPYLVGYVQADLVPATAAPTRAPEASASQAAGAVPQRLADETSHPLHQLAPGTQVMFDGRVIAVLQAAGYARELHRYETGEVDVFVAATDAVAVRGMVSAAALQAASEGATPRGAPPVPAPVPVAPGAPANAPIPPAPAPPRGSLVSPGSE